LARRVRGGTRACGAGTPYTATLRSITAAELDVYTRWRSGNWGQFSAGLSTRSEAERRRARPEHPYTATPGLFTAAELDICTRWTAAIWNNRLPAQHCPISNRQKERCPDHLENRKKDSEDNVKSGKCAVENFGKFYVTPLEERVVSIEEERKRAEAEQRRIDFLSSPEGKETEKKRKAAIAADPLHPLHTVDHESILSRVRFAPEPSKNWREAERLKNKIHRHCHSYVRTLGLDTQQSVDKTGDLVCMIQKNALAELNGYYQQEELAVPEQLQEAIDEAIRIVEPRMPLLFAEEAAVGHNG
jgi:hypothetical protein